MRLATTLFSILALSTLVACGGGGGGDDTAGDDTTDPPDAEVTDPPPDAPDTTGVTGLGEVCTVNPSSCPAEASLCAPLAGQADTMGFCTLSCGTGPVYNDPTMAMPPEGGNEMCQAAYTGTTGTPSCTLYSNDTQNNQSVWFCAVLCGTVNNMDLGACPDGLTCGDASSPFPNICDV